MAKRTPSQVGRGSKQKGSAFENSISKKIREYFLPDVDKKTSYNLVHRTPLSGGHSERGDLIVQPPLLEYFPWFVEARNRQSWSWENILKKGKDSVIIKWFLEDAVDKCHPYAGRKENERWPLLIFTKNQDQWYVCHYQRDLFQGDKQYSSPFFWRWILPDLRGEHGDIAITTFDAFLDGHVKPNQEEFHNLTFK